MSQIARNRAPEIKKLCLIRFYFVKNTGETIVFQVREEISKQEEKTGKLVYISVVSEDNASGGAAGIGIFVKVENLDVDKVGLQ